MENKEKEQSLQAIINDVIDARNDNKKEYERKANEMDRWLDFSKSITAHSRNPYWRDILSEEKSLNENWEKIKSSSDDLAKSIKKIWNKDNPLLPFSQAKTRAERDYINIAIAAAWRQGKSTFLRRSLNFNEIQIEGVSINDYLIPTAGAQDDACTGTSINYVNDSQNYAEIHYYTLSDIISNINALLSVVKIADKPIAESLLIPEDSSSEAFKSKIQEIKDQIGDALESQATKKSLDQTLNNYIQGLSNEIIDLIAEKEGGKDKIPFKTKKDLESFYRKVCYYPNPETEEERTFEVLATKRATVFASFKFNGVNPGKIRFLDTPGIGEARTSVENTLIDIIQKDVDIIILVSKTGAHKIEDVKKFHSLLKQHFNYSVLEKGKRLYDTTDFLFYVVNVNTDKKDSTYKRETYECYNSCIEESLCKNDSDGTKSIHLNPDNVAYIDCEKDQQYLEHEITSGNLDGKTVKYVDLKSPSPRGCSDFIFSILDSLKEKISSIDNYFNREALSKYDEVNSKIDGLKRQICDFELPDVEEVSYRIATLVNKIKKGVDKVNDGVHQSIESCNTKIENQYSPKGYSCVLVDEFLSKICGIDPGLHSLQESSNSTDDSTSDDLNKTEEEHGTEDVVDKFKAFENKILDGKYNLIKELERYSRLRVEFRDYNIEKMKLCLGIDVIQTDCETKVTAINNIFKEERTGKLFMTEHWMETFVAQYSGSYPTLTRHFTEICGYKVAGEVVKDFFETKLKDRFHQEKIHGEKGDGLFADSESCVKTFIYWLVDIADAIVKALLDKNGNASIINELNAYMEKFDTKLDEFKCSLEEDKDGKAREELFKFIGKKDNKPIIFDDIKDRKGAVDVWNNLKEDYIK